MYEKSLNLREELNESLSFDYSISTVGSLSLCIIAFPRAVFVNFCIALINLANCYLSFGRLVQAQDLYEEAIKIRQSILPSQHPRLALG